MIKDSDKMITKLRGKLDRMRYIVTKRLRLMGYNLSKKLRHQGFNPVIKYHRMYQQLINPILNPYLQQTWQNKLNTPVDQQNNQNFQALQSNLEQYGNAFAESLANMKSGLYTEPTVNNFKV